MNIGKRVAIASLSVGALGYFVPYLIGPSHWEWETTIGLSLAILWAGALVSCLVRFGKRGLWFFIGAPLALWWPFIVFMMLWLVVR